MKYYWGSRWTYWLHDRLHLLLESKKENADKLTEEIKAKCLAPDMLESERTKVATRLISAITEMVIYSLLKKLSSSFGSKALYSSFTRLAEEQADIPSYKLINAMIGLDNSRGFPKKQIEAAYYDLKEFHLGKRMLQRLVWSHFMKYQVEFDTKQWASHLLNIKYVSSTKSQKPPKLSRAK